MEEEIPTLRILSQPNDDPISGESGPSEECPGMGSGEMTAPRLSDRLFQLIVEAAPTGMILIDRTGQLVLVNAQIETLFGYSREELLGRPVEVLVPQRFRGSHPAYRGHFFDDPRPRAMGRAAICSVCARTAASFPSRSG